MSVHLIRGARTLFAVKELDRNQYKIQFMFCLGALPISESCSRQGVLQSTSADLKHTNSFQMNEGKNLLLDKQCVEVVGCFLRRQKLMFLLRAYL